MSLTIWRSRVQLAEALLQVDVVGAGNELDLEDVVDRPHRDADGLTTCIASTCKGVGVDPLGHIRYLPGAASGRALPVQEHWPRGRVRFAARPRPEAGTAVGAQPGRPSAPFYGELAALPTSRATPGRRRRSRSRRTGREGFYAAIPLFRGRAFYARKTRERASATMRMWPWGCLLASAKSTSRPAPTSAARRRSRPRPTRGTGRERGASEGRGERTNKPRDEKPGQAPPRRATANQGGHHAHTILLITLILAIRARAGEAGRLATLEALARFIVDLCRGRA